MKVYNWGPIKCALYKEVFFIYRWSLEQACCISIPAYLGPKQKTADDIDQTFQVNYLGHFYLTRLLVKKLHPTKDTPMRIVNMTSGDYHKGALDFDDIAVDKTTFDMYNAYCRTKLALLLFANELNFHYATWGVTCVCVHPGELSVTYSHGHGL